MFEVFHQKVTTFKVFKNFNITPNLAQVFLKLILKSSSPGPYCFLVTNGFYKVNHFKVNVILFDRCVDNPRVSQTCTSPLLLLDVAMKS